MRKMTEAMRRTASMAGTMGNEMEPGRFMMYGWLNADVL
jgi:hypothetical protein